MTRQPDPEPCPRCDSQKTIRTTSEARFDYWHCYDCGKTFDVQHTTDTSERAGQRRAVPR